MLGQGWVIPEELPGYPQAWLRLCFRNLATDCIRKIYNPLTCMAIIFCALAKIKLVLKNYIGFHLPSPAVRSLKLANHIDGRQFSN